MSSLKAEAEQICKSLFMLNLRRENLVSVRLKLVFGVFSANLRIKNFKQRLQNSKTFCQKVEKNVKKFI